METRAAPPSSSAKKRRFRAKTIKVVAATKKTAEELASLKKVAELAREINHLLETDRDATLEIGRRLLAVQKVLTSSGKFSAWINKELHIERRSAYHYLSLARFVAAANACETVSHVEKLIPVKIRFAAAYALGQEDIPPALIKAALGEANKGKHAVTKEWVLKRANKATPERTSFHARTFDGLTNLEIPEKAFFAKVATVRDHLVEIRASAKAGDLSKVEKLTVKLFNELFSRKEN